MTHVPTWNVPPVHKNIMDAPPPPNTASVNDIRAQGELPSRLACHWIWLSPGLWCPSCSISVWLWDSRLKQTLIIPLVKHADKSCFFFISNSSELVYFGTWKGCVTVHSVIVTHFYALFRAKLVKRDRR